MNLIQTIGAILGAWTGSVAAAVIAGFDRVVSPRVIRLIEDDQGGFAVETTGKPDNVPARIEFAMGTLGNKVILFGGLDVDSDAAMNDTCTFDGTTWTQLSVASSPPGRHLAMMATLP